MTGHRGLTLLLAGLFGLGFAGLALALALAPVGVSPAAAQEGGAPGVAVSLSPAGPVVAGTAMEVAMSFTGAGVRRGPGHGGLRVPGGGEHRGKG